MATSGVAPIQMGGKRKTRKVHRKQKKQQRKTQRKSQH